MFTRSETTKTVWPISNSKFKSLIKHYDEKIRNDADSNMYQFDKLLRNAGFLSTLTKIDFERLPMNLYRAMICDLQFNGIKFNQCRLPRDASYKNCEFVECEFLQHIGYTSSPSNSVFYVANDDARKRLSNMGFDKNDNIFLYSNSTKPIIGVVYFKSHGTNFTDKIIKILNQHQVQVVNLGPEILNHSIAQDFSFLDGIVLPGGGNVITNAREYSDREKLEVLLLKTALKHKIPTLGVCRGHQFIGHYFGAKIINTDNHYEKHNIIHVPQDENSKLFNLTEKKFEAQTRKRKVEKITQEEDGYHYPGYCVHKQGLFFQQPIPPRKKIKITATTDDGLAECLEVRDHIISFQHHHEVQQKDSIARAAMAMFMKMVIEYSDQKNGMDVQEEAMQII